MSTNPLAMSANPLALTMASPTPSGRSSTDRAPDSVMGAAQALLHFPTEAPDGEDAEGAAATAASSAAAAAVAAAAGAAAGEGAEGAPLPHEDFHGVSPLGSAAGALLRSWSTQEDSRPRSSSFSEATGGGGGGGPAGAGARRKSRNDKRPVKRPRFFGGEGAEEDVEDGRAPRRWRADDDDGEDEAWDGEDEDDSPAPRRKNSTSQKASAAAAAAASAVGASYAGMETTFPPKKEKKANTSNNSGTRTVRQEFPVLLRKMLDDCDGGDAIGWVEQGSAFAVFDEQKLVTRILPRLFNVSKIESFQRQLNLYRFRKERPKRRVHGHWPRYPAGGIWRHEHGYFARNSPHLVDRIVRLKNTSFRVRDRMENS